MTHLAVTVPVNERWRTVSGPAKALAQDIQTAGGRLVLDVGGRMVTPHGYKDALAQIDRLQDLLDQLRAEI